MKLSIGVVVMTVLCCILTISTVSAISHTYTRSVDGFGTFSDSWGDDNNYRQFIYQNDIDTANLFFECTWHCSYINNWAYHTIYYGSGFGSWAYADPAYIYGSGTSTKSFDGGDNTDGDIQMKVETYYPFSSPGHSGSMVYTVSDQPITKFTLSGTVQCITSTDLYIRDKFDNFILIGSNASDNYEYPINNNSYYRVLFSDGYSEEFLCNGSKTVDRDGCVICALNIVDNCGKPMTNTSVDVFLSEGGDMSTYTLLDNYWATNPIQLIIGSDCNLTDQLDVFIHSDMGTVHKTVFVEETTHNLFHPTKYWVFTFIAEDDMTGIPIEGVKTVVNQSCKINPSTPLLTHTFTNTEGKATFGGLSGNLIYTWMHKSGEYKNERFFAGFGFGSGGDAFETNYYITVPMNASANDTLPDWTNETENVSTECSIRFKTEAGLIKNRINDTDNYVDLYYDNGNCSATLRFEKCYGASWIQKVSWVIPTNESGYKRILNANFTDADYCYRGRMYSYECDCNSTLALYVINETQQEEEHYQNLTTYTRFKHKLSGNQIDYRSDVAIYAYANATDAFLLDINLTLYNNTQVIATKQTDWADYSSATKKWWYMWYPDVSYEIGENYTTIMTGYNGANLSADSVWTSDIRKFSVIVYTKDRHNNALSNCKVYMQGWGEIDMSTDTSTVISGLSTGIYQIQATHTGYASSGWHVVNITTTDEYVTLKLRSITGSDSVVGVKLKDTEIKEIYIPLMYMLLILIIFGGLWYVTRN